MLSLYAETVLEVKSVTDTSRLVFQIPRKNGSYDNSRPSRRRTSVNDNSEDDRTFSEQHLASSSSFYFRETKHYPRAFSWRILQDRRVLEIQPADLSRSERDQKEAYLTFSFTFQDPILPLGITFVDPPKADELHAFVCTSRNEIFNLRLPTEYFRTASSVSQNVGDWCRPIDVSSLSIDTVYHIHASTPYELFVAFVGGRIQALRRKADSENWTQDYYDDSSWGSTLRGIVGRRGQQQIEYGSTKLSATAVQGMVTSPDANYLYTMCLNHTLRIWHLPSGKLADSRDLLDAARDGTEQIHLSPSEPGLIRLVRHPKGRHPMLVTYTPHEGGQFKFWNIKGGLADPLVVSDRYPKVKLSPPDPDPTGNTVWSVTGFEMTPGNESKPSQLWVLWRNNNYHQAYTLHFDFPTLADAWTKNWVRISLPASRPRGPDLVLTDSEDVTSKWLDFLFFPGRYSPAVLENALSRYRSLTAVRASQSQRHRPLPEQICSTVASLVSLRKYEDSEVDYDRFAIDTDHQWRNYWRIVENLNDDRYAPLSLSFDVFSDMAWISMADCHAAIRECSKAELLQLNRGGDLEDLEDVAAERWPYRKAVPDIDGYTRMSNLLEAGEKFRKSFSPEVTNDLWTAIEEELYTQSEMSISDRIVLIFNQVGFSDGLSEGAEEQLLKDLQPAGGLEGVNNETFLAILDLLSTTTKRPKSNLRNTIFGTNLLSTALLDDIVSTRNLLLDLLVLIIFIDESDNFDPSELFELVLSSIKAQEQNSWLATHFRSTPLEFLGIAAKPSKQESVASDSQTSRTVTVLEDIFLRSMRPQPAVDRPMMYLLTDLVAESQNWISGKDAVTPDDAAVHIQCDLIVHQNLDLATDFLKFQPATPWSTYIKGRLRLARAEHVEAGICFRQSAYTLACGKAIGDLKGFSAGMLSILDAEHFNSGMPRFLQHVMGLFESKKAYAQAAEFARASLEALTPGQAEPVPNFKTEVLSRLFTAELKCAKFASAFEAVVRLPDRALQKSSTVALINAMLDPKLSTLGIPSALAAIKNLPWSTHPHLAKHVDQHVLSLAKKQTTIPVLGQWASSGLVDYLSILYALRLSKNDHRGATAVLFDRLRIVQKSGRARSEPHAVSIRHALLALINALNCVAPDEAYILAQVDDDPRLQAMTKRRRTSTDEADSQARKRKRVIVTLDDLRREYQSVLDRCSRIERGDFDFDVNGEGDSDAEEQELGTNGSRVNGDTMEL